MAAKIYKNQNKLRIQLTGNVAMSGATAYIAYRKPDNTTGEWTGIISDAVNGIVYYDLVSVNELDVAGVWTIWLRVVFSDARVGYGQPYQFTVYDAGRS